MRSGWFSPIDPGLTIVVILQSCAGMAMVDVDLCAHDVGPAQVTEFIDRFPHGEHIAVGQWDYQAWQSNNDPNFATPFEASRYPLISIKPLLRY